MSINLNDNIKLNAGKPLDSKYLNGVVAYLSIAEVNSIVSISERYLGLTVLIGTDEYWYHTSIADIGLVIKTVVVPTSTFTSDIVVSLSGVKTLGKYSNGQTILATGKTFEQVMRDIAIEDIAPTYTIATLGLTKTSATTAEVGTSYSNTLNATFTQNDAGSLTAIRIQKNGSDIVPNGTTSPFSKVDTGLYVNGSISYRGFADYNSGVIKTYYPSGTSDARTPAIRNSNAPQSAESGFGSSTLTITGYYNIFFGSSASAPVNSADVRALSNSQLTVVGNTFTLNTGATNIIFSIAVPATKSLVSVVDLDALNANITASYVLSTFNVNDASGTPVAYKIYTMTIAVAYASSHRHSVTIA
jgi:hypothetical protein